MPRVCWRPIHAQNACMGLRTLGVMEREPTPALPGRDRDRQFTDAHRMGVSRPRCPAHALLEAVAASVLHRPDERPQTRGVQVRARAGARPGDELVREASPHTRLRSATLVGQGRHTRVQRSGAHATRGRAPADPHNYGTAAGRGLCDSAVGPDPPDGGASQRGRGTRTALLPWPATTLAQRRAYDREVPRPDLRSTGAPGQHHRLCPPGRARRWRTQDLDDGGISPRPLCRHTPRAPAHSTAARHVFGPPGRAPVLCCSSGPPRPHRNPRGRRPLTDRTGSVRRQSRRT